MGPKLKKWAWLGQWTAALVVASGMGLELALGADVWFVLITGGALGFAMFTKWRHEA